MNPRIPPAWRLPCVVVLLVVPLMVVAGPMIANEPPRNLREPLVIHAAPSLQGLRETLAAEFPAIRDDVEALLGTRYTGSVECYVVANDTEAGAVFAKLFRLPGYTVVPGVSGWALPRLGTIILNVSALARHGIISEARATLRHEYAHLVLGQFSLAANQPWPAWFEEGVCQWVQRSIYPPNSVVQAIRAGTQPLPSLAEVSRLIDAKTAETPVGYALAEDAAGSLLREFPPAQRPRRLATLTQVFATTGNFEHAFAEAFAVSLATFEAEWRHRNQPGGVEGWFTFFATYWWELFCAFGAVLMIVALRRRRKQYEAAMRDDDPALTSL